MVASLALATACSGGDFIKPNPEPVPSANVYEIYEENLNDGKLTVVEQGFVIPSEGQEIAFRTYKEGQPPLSLGNQWLLLRDADNFNFWHKFMTTEYHENPQEVIDNFDAVLIMNYRTRWQYYFVMEKMMFVDGVLNIYYSYRANFEAEQGIVDYKFYLIDKTVGSYNFIEVE